MIMLPDVARIERLLETCGLSLGPHVAARVMDYLEHLLKWNQHLNLTGFQEPDEQVVSLFGESFLAARLLTEKDSPLLDVGSGAGFPGMALKLVLPHLHCYLLEPRKKRAAFLAAVRRELQLAPVQILTKSLEDCRPDDFVSPPRVMTLRALGRPESLIRKGLGLLSSDARLLLFTTGTSLESAAPVSEQILWDAPLPIPWSRQKLILPGRVRPVEEGAP